MANPVNPIVDIVPNKLPCAYRRDLPWTLDFDNTGDLKMVEDVDAMNQSIYTILVTNFGDKPLEEFFGANISPLLFENASPPNFLTFEIQSRLKSAVEKDEPSLIILKCDVDLGDISRNIVRVTIVYYLSDGITTGIFDENLSIFNKRSG